MHARSSVDDSRMDRTVNSQVSPVSAGGLCWTVWTHVRRRTIGMPLLVIVCAAATAWLHLELDHRQPRLAAATEQLRVLPRGEILKPAMLGYTQVGADLLWLRIVQVMGEAVLSSEDAAWLAHALDVVTTLDPEFLIAYDLGAGFLAEVTGQVAWSNALLEKGRTANPDAWRLPFLLGFNHFFHLQDYARAAGYMAEAARLQGAPAYVPELAARLYVEGHRPEAALAFLDALLAQTDHPQLSASLERRHKAVRLEQDLDRLEQAREAHVRATGQAPDSLDELVRNGWLEAIPQEPFGGAYVLEQSTGRVISTTHPERMRLYRPADAQAILRASVQP